MSKRRLPSTIQRQQQAGGILDHAANTLITGGNFTTVINSYRGNEEGFKRLQEHAATTAFHNSAQRIDPPRCHENTRQAVLQELFDWILRDANARTEWIAWLHGAAGAGKSAICQSLAEMCIARGIPVASFFFFHTDRSRNTIGPLVATLAYQVIQNFPATKDVITEAVESDPLIFEQALDTQIEALIIKPLRQLNFSGSSPRLFIIIDGLDECITDDDQVHLIRVITKLLSANHLPLIVLFGSRAENHIRMAFNSLDITNILFRLPLDNHYLPDIDIRLFLEDSLRDVRQTHPFGQRLDPQWPAPALVQEIVDKSSGQFIYASVVAKFVSLPHFNPAAQLDIVRGLRSSGLATPFAQLDALYRHIFSRVIDLETTTTFLAYAILAKKMDRDYIAMFFDVPEDDVHIAFADLTSVIACDNDKLRVLHASLPDFLFDRARSRDYYIDAAEWSTRLSISWFRNAASERWKEWFDSSFINLLNQAEGVPELRASVLDFNPSVLFGEFFGDYLTSVEKLDFGDGGHVYRHQLKMVTRFLRGKGWSWELAELRKKHKISVIERKGEYRDTTRYQAW